MRTITALLFAGVVLTGGMAAMAADITGPEVDPPALVEPERPDVVTVPERPDIPVGQETVDPGPIDADVEAPDGPIDDVDDPPVADEPDIPVREEEEVDPGPIEGDVEDPDVTIDDVGDENEECPATRVCDDAEIDPERDDVGHENEECPATRICDDPEIDPESGCTDEFCEPIVRGPVAVNDNYAFETSTSSATLPVLENDVDLDGDTLEIIRHEPTFDGLTCGAAECRITLSSPRTVTFRYTVSDGELEASASVTVVVRPPDNLPPEPQPDEFEVDQGDDPIDLDVLANDVDPDEGDVLSISGNGGSTLGDVVCDNAATSCNFTPGRQPGTATFEYTVSDGDLQASAEVTVVIRGPINRGPVAVDDDFTVQLSEGTVALPLLVNDSDPDGDAFTVVGDPTFGLGTLDCGATTCDFVHAGVPGTDTFVYTITDGVATASATVIVRVPDSPPSEADPTRESPDPTVRTSNPTPDPTQDTPEPTDPTPETTERTPETTITTPEPPATAGNVPSSSNQPSTSTTIDQPTERRIVRLEPGAVANSAPTSGSALSLVSAFWLLAPIAALLRRRRHDPSDIQIPGG